MTFPILGGNSAVGGYAIDNSLRFNDDDSPVLSRTPSSASNRTTYTFSCWVKRSNLSTGNQRLFSVEDDASADFRLRFISNDTLAIYDSTSSLYLISTQVFRDVSSWYHIVAQVDTTQGTSSDRANLYVNGVKITDFSTETYPSSSATGLVNTTYEHNVGGRIYQGSVEQPFDGYMAEVHFIDGQALSPTDFGEFDEDSGIWKPIEYEGTYGTNGFYLDFENSGSLGADQSGNNNNFTPTNLASTDQMLDTPTNNFCTLNVLNKRNNPVYSEGNLKVTTSGTFEGICTTTFGLSSGKWYFEYVHLTSDATVFGIVTEDVPINAWQPSSGTDWAALRCLGNFQSNTGSTPTDTSSFNNGDIISGAFDLDTGEIEFFVNGSSVGTITGITTDVVYFPFIADLGSLSGRNLNGVLNLGQDSSFAGNKTRQNNSDSNGKGDFYYAPPSGYLALCTQNLATELSPTIDDGSQYFNTVLYTGNGSTQSITGVGFQPDWTWFKERSSTSGHEVYDSTRGATKLLSPNTTDAEGTNASALTSFDSDGFSVGSGGAVNENSQTYVGWNWKANAGSTSSNTDGSITSTVQANTTAGFSIVTFTGTGLDATVGHGLNVAPDMVIVKSRDAARNWPIYHRSLGGDASLKLNLTDATSTSLDCWNDLDPTSTVVNLGTTGGSNVSGEDAVMYCFHSVEGYSKFGKYTGNGSTDGTFIYTGFRPAFTLIKRTDAAQAWVLHDSARAGYINPTDNYVYANATNVEAEDIDHDYLSNGFKIRATFNDTNASGGTYIYMAFAENPFVSSGAVPVTAR